MYVLVLFLTSQLNNASHIIMEWKCTWMENESNSYFDSIYFDEFTLDQYINILHSRQQETKILFRGGGYWKCVEKCYIKWMEYNIQSSAHTQN